MVKAGSAVLVFAVGALGGVWLPLHLDSLAAGREQAIIEQTRMHASYSQYLDAAMNYKSELGQVGLMQASSQEIPDLTYEQLSDRAKLDKVQGAYFEFEKAASVAARDVTPKSLSAFNDLRGSLPSVGDLVSSGETLETQEFNEAYYDFVARYRVEARGSEPIWGP